MKQTLALVACLYSLTSTSFAQGTTGQLPGITGEAYDLGNGYGHVAFAVDDLAAEHERISGLGYEPGEIKELHREGTMLARYFFLSDPDGYKIEMLQRHGRYR